MLVSMVEVDRNLLKSFLKYRENDSHKGMFGHLLLMCGCSSMPGAAVLATGAALKSGCGLVTLHSSANASAAAIARYPSAMLSAAPLEGNRRYSAIAAGPGLGKSPETVAVLRSLMSSAKDAGIPMLLDADALNILAENPDMTELVPEGSVMTPHLGELRRLLGQEASAGKDRGELRGQIQKFSRKTGCVIVAKGFRTEIYPSDSDTLYVNPSGNAGMAKGGSGDVLTGLVGGLMARGYTALQAALLGVWIHGYAGDVLSEECTAESYDSADLIDRLYLGFKRLYEDI